MLTKILALAGATVMAATVAGCASQPHTYADMLAGQHPMPPKGWMQDRAMPSRSRDCTEEALAKMPPEHRQACPQAQQARGAH